MINFSGKKIPQHFHKEISYGKIEICIKNINKLKKKHAWVAMAGTVFEY